MTRLRRLLPSAVLLAALAVLPAAAHAAGPLSLTTVKLAGADDKTEPRIAVGPDDRRWAVTNAGGTAVVYSSRDGGASFQRTAADPQQRGATIDTDIVTMHTGRVLASELDEAGLNFPSSVTDDGGATWTEAKGATELADQDRQWFAVGPDDPATHKPTVYLLYHNLGSGFANHNMFVAKSTDGGETFGPPIPTTIPGDTAYADLQCADSGGPSSITVNQKTGRIYVVFTTRASNVGGNDAGGCAATPLEFNIVNATRVWVATSADDTPGSWQKSLAVDDSATNQVVSMQLAYGTLDNQGGMYVAYPESPKPYPDLGGAALKVTYQRPDAQGAVADGQWAAPRTLVPAVPSGDLGTTLVHVAAGDPGKVVVADYEAEHLPQAGGDPVWYPHLVQSLDLLSAQPHVTDQKVADIPAYRWTASQMMGLCSDPSPVQGVENGTACSRSTDVWGIALDSSCRVSIAWPTSATKASNGIVTGKLPNGSAAAPPGSTAGLPGADPGTFVTTQTGGPGLCASPASLPGGSQGAPFTTPAGTQGAAGSGCRDRLAPVSRFRGAPVATRRSLRLRGTSTDLACVGGHAGRRATATLRTIRVSIGRRLAGTRCRFLQGDGRFGPPVSCLRTSYVTAQGRASWTLRIKAHLPRGRYVAWARGLDAFGNIERKARGRNLIRFVVR
jgi:hypothetical protein